PLHELALKHKAEVWFDMGLAPGMSNLVAGLFAQKIPNCEEISLYVGGLPVERVFPYEYRAVFSPTDVIEEYTRPARIVREGVVRSLPALSEPEFLEVPKIGTLEAFLTDGLRSLIDNLSIPNMREMTLRYPGHREFMLRLREGGFFSDDTLQNSGMTARQATEQVLLKGWHMADTDADCTVFVGIGKNLDSEHRISMIDYRDPVTSYTSMARTTGFVAAAIASFLITNGKIRGSGVFAPEKLVDHPEALTYLNRYLLERNVAYMGLEGLI
ncbi:MAG: hypothetical protein KDD60_12430, partial [Bdellovibrionales bacterium]|nr:hypothetical protein [Bdellovibrionales bacterium]